uniref:Transposase n=1 Tax=Heterorhabditis bacteriophora TaxID=37862 RepID=A0A1I7WI98_HETBA
MLYYLFTNRFGYKPYDNRITPVESVWTSVTAEGITFTTPSLRNVFFHKFRIIITIKAMKQTNRIK